MTIKVYKVAYLVFSRHMHGIIFLKSGQFSALVAEVQLVTLGWIKMRNRLERIGGGRGWPWEKSKAEDGPEGQVHPNPFTQHAEKIFTSLILKPSILRDFTSSNLLPSAMLKAEMASVSCPKFSMHWCKESNCPCSSLVTIIVLYAPSLATAAWLQLKTPQNSQETPQKGPFF